MGGKTWLQTVPLLQHYPIAAAVATAARTNPRGDKKLAALPGKTTPKPSLNNTPQTTLPIQISPKMRHLLCLTRTLRPHKNRTVGQYIQHRNINFHFQRCSGAFTPKSLPSICPVGGRSPLLPDAEVTVTTGRSSNHVSWNGAKHLSRHMHCTGLWRALDMRVTTGNISKTSSLRQVP